jgi:hypothetical protein
MDQFIVRTDMTMNRVFYLVSKTLGTIVASPSNNTLKVIHAGMRVFERKDFRDPELFPYRMSSSATDLMHPFLSDKRMLYLTKPDLKVLMQHQNPKFEQLSPDLNVQLDRMTMGCCLCRLLGDDDIFTQDVLIPVWKAAVSVMILVAKKDHEYALFYLSNVFRTLGHRLGIMGE